jgi:hypothetical protein
MFKFKKMFSFKKYSKLKNDIEKVQKRLTVKIKSEVVLSISFASC